MLLTVAAETHQCRTRRKCEGANCPRTSFQTNPHCNGSNPCWRSYVRIVEDSQCYKMPDLVSTHNLQMYTSFITYDISWCFPVGFDLDGIRCRQLSQVIQKSPPDSASSLCNRPHSGLTHRLRDHENHHLSSHPSACYLHIAFSISLRK